MNDTARSNAELRILDTCKLKWRLPEDPVAESVLIPGLRASDQFDCMVGFFGGEALRELAPGLAAFVAHAEQPMRLLVSPVMSADDIAGMRMGVTLPEEVLADAVGASLSDQIALEDALANHTLHCLAYLLAAKRLEIKVVLVNDGLFHTKEWILRAGNDIAVLSGSANFTGRAMRRNVESLHLHRSWRDTDNLDTCVESVTEFEMIWAGKKHNMTTVDLPTAISEELVQTYGTSKPTEHDFELALQQTSSEMDAPIDSQTHEMHFVIPPHLDINSGPYAHQGVAVDRWETSGRSGILAMATGAGKTISALVAARRLLDEVGSLLLVIAVPTKPLVSQWASECADFGLRPLVTTSLARTARLQKVQAAIDDLEFDVSEVEVIIVTNQGLIDPDVTQIFNAYSGPALLIADEVHNLGGVREFLESPPTWPTSKLGLSATPIRQYDEEGTEALLEYFGEVVFEFSLEEAIGTCLVPYDYFVHRVDLTITEREEYSELSEQIRRRYAALGAEGADSDAQLTVLLNKRRLILETAERKLRVLEDLLDGCPKDGVRRTLFYATDKDPRQLNELNEILRSRRIRAHQVTEAETSSGRLLSATMDAFATGVLHALTAKRVLDEGLNVPQIDTAYILASTTVRKQWVQRRGRVLRPSPGTGKTHAVIHDFIVVPPAGSLIDDDERKAVQSELVRGDEFARLARNRASEDGPLTVLSELWYEFVI